MTKDNPSLDSLRLEKGGKLIGVYWDYETRTHPEKEITDIPSVNSIHDKTCAIGEGVTLKDVFLYLNKELDYWTLMIGNWCDEIVTEGLKPRPESHKDDDGWSETEGLILYWHSEICEFKGQRDISGLDRLDFGAYGHYTKDCEWGSYKAGDPVNIAVDFSPANTIAHLPIKFEKEVHIWDWTKEGPPEEIPVKLGERDASLFQILYGIIWELSFMGGPETRDEQAAQIRKSADEVMSGEAKTIPWEDLKKELEEMDDDKE